MKKSNAVVTKRILVETLRLRIYIIACGYVLKPSEGVKIRLSHCFVRNVFRILKIRNSIAVNPNGFLIAMQLNFPRCWFFWYELHKLHLIINTVYVVRPYLIQLHAFKWQNHENSNTLIIFIHFSVIRDFNCFIHENIWRKFHYYLRAIFTTFWKLGIMNLFAIFHI